MDVQIVIHLLLDEVAHILVDALSARSHLQRSELNLGLRLEHRLLHIDGEGMIFLAVLVGMREGNLDVLTLHVYDGIERFGGHRVCEQVGESVARHDSPTVIHDGQTGVEIGIVAEHRLHEVVMK